MVITGWRLRKIAREIGKDLLVGEDAIDLRIGTEFKILKPGHEYVKFQDGEVIEPKCSPVKTGTVSYKGMICIDPGDLLIIPTYEHLSLPGNVMGMINLRSYAARGGLHQATALKISPGFRGYPVLELTTTRPACIAYKEPIVQLILLETSDSVEYAGRFQNQDASILYRG